MPQRPDPNKKSQSHARRMGNRLRRDVASAPSAPIVTGSVGPGEEIAKLFDIPGDTIMFKVPMPNPAEFETFEDYCKPVDERLEEFGAIADGFFSSRILQALDENGNLMPQCFGVTITIRPVNPEDQPDVVRPDQN